MSTFRFAAYYTVESDNMIKIISDCIFTLLSLFGFAFLLYIILKKILLKGASCFTVIVGESEDDRLSEKVFAAVIDANLTNLSKRNKVIVLDRGVTLAAKRACQHILNGDDDVVFCGGDDLEAVISSLC